jgi:hypothetical protein
MSSQVALNHKAIFNSQGENNVLDTMHIRFMYWRLLDGSAALAFGSRWKSASALQQISVHFPFYRGIEGKSLVNSYLDRKIRISRKRYEYFAVSADYELTLTFLNAMQPINSHDVLTSRKNVIRDIVLTSSDHVRCGY